MAACKLPAELASWIAPLASMLHGRVAWRLLPLLVGALFAQGRKTVASWLRGGRLGGEFQSLLLLSGQPRPQCQRRRGPTFPPGGTGRRAGRALVAGHRRHADQALRAARRRRGDSSQSDAGPSGPEVCLRPCVGDVVVGGAAYVVGNARSAVVGLAVRAAEEHQEH